LLVAGLGQRQVARTEKSKLQATAEEEQRKRLEARRDDLRTVLDEAAKTAMSIRLAASAEELGSQREAVQEIRNVVLRAHELLARIGVRVGPDHVLYSHYEGVAGALDDWRAARARARATDGGASDAELAAAESTAADACRQALEGFLDAANTQLDRWERERPGNS
jgi:hypothetical protein